MEIFLKFVGTSPLAEFVEYDADKEPLLDFLYREIGCESVESVIFRGAKVPDWMLGIVDEEGLHKPQHKQNAMGTLLYGGLLVGPLLIGSRGFRGGEPDFVGFGDREEAMQAYNYIWRAVFGEEAPKC